jgi:hypothetical protein
MTQMKRLLKRLFESQGRDARPRVEPIFDEAPMVIEHRPFRIKQRTSNQIKPKRRLLKRGALIFSELSLAALAAACAAILLTDPQAREQGQSAQFYSPAVDSGRNLNKPQVEDSVRVSRGAALYFPPNSGLSAAGQVTWTRRNSEIRANALLPGSSFISIKFFRPLDKGVDAEFLVEIQFGATADRKTPTDISAISMKLGSDGVDRLLAGASAPVDRDRFWFALTPGRQTYNRRLLTSASWLSIEMLLKSGEIARIRVEYPAMAKAFFKKMTTES